jgi:putative toxin-antitoxin system antitoxin component (TIGR02293 family)
MSQVANTPPAGAGFYARLEGKLGIPGIHSDEDLVALVERRLPASAVQALVASGLSDAEAYGLIVPRRTLAHRRAKREPLSREESDKAVRVARITSLAEQAFGEPDRAWRWMRKPKRRFQGRTPIEMLATEAGARLVEEMIYQVDDGVAA